MPRCVGNPNRKKDQSAVCAFELKANELGLTPDQYIQSRELRAWAVVHKNTRYIPEALLKVWGLVPDSFF
jgi:hypothetical protein